MIRSTLFFFFLSSILVCAQSIELKLGGNANFYLSSETESNPYVPREYQDIRELPSVSKFYSDNFNLAPEILFAYSDGEYVYKLGVAYQNYKLESQNWSTAEVLGNELQFEKITPSFYIGKYLQNIPAVNVHLLIGLSFQNTKAENVIPGSRAVAHFNYKSSTNFIAGAGVELKANNILFGLSLKGEFGSFDRDIVNVYDNGNYMFSLEPTGEKNIVNNSIILNFYVGYSFALWDKK